MKILGTTIHDTVIWCAGLKGVSSAVTFAAGIMAFLATEVSTQNVWFGVLSTALATIVVGIATNYPKWVKAKGEDWASIVREMRASHIDQNNELKLIVARQNRERSLMRHTKHELAGAFGLAVDRVRLMEFQLYDNDIPFDSYIPPNVRELYAHEDAEMDKLTKDAFDSTVEEIKRTQTK